MVILKKTTTTCYITQVCNLEESEFPIIPC